MTIKELIEKVKEESIMDLTDEEVMEMDLAIFDPASDDPEDDYIEGPLETELYFDFSDENVREIYLYYIPIIDQIKEVE